MGASCPARALYNDPRILFLDEGTANLDPESEARILALLGQLDITQIVVAHRQAAIEACNRVFLVKDGTVLELEPRV